MPEALQPILQRDHATDRPVERGAHAPVLLTPRRITPMVARRAEFQIRKFRTTGSDCVPNL